jgi:hypothetical protein
MARYLVLIVWPMRLSADYSYAQIPLATGRLLDWVAWAIVAAIAAGCVLLWRRDRTTFFWAGFALLTFLPGIEPALPHRHDHGRTRDVSAVAWRHRADRLGRAGKWRRPSGLRPQRYSAAPLSCACVVAGFAVRTWIRNNDWQSDVSL